jgi:hypothetical protein
MDIIGLLYNHNLAKKFVPTQEYVDVSKCLDTYHRIKMLSPEGDGDETVKIHIDHTLDLVERVKNVIDQRDNIIKKMETLVNNGPIFTSRFEPLIQAQIDNECNKFPKNALNNKKLCFVNGICKNFEFAYKHAMYIQYVNSKKKKGKEYDISKSCLMNLAEVENDDDLADYDGETGNDDKVIESIEDWMKELYISLNNDITIDNHTEWLISVSEQLDKLPDNIRTCDVPKITKDIEKDKLAELIEFGFINEEDKPEEMINSAINELKNEFITILAEYKTKFVRKFIKIHLFQYALLFRKDGIIKRPKAGSINVKVEHERKTDKRKSKKQEDEDLDFTPSEESGDSSSDSSDDEVDERKHNSKSNISKRKRDNQDSEEEKPEVDNQEEDNSEDDNQEKNPKDDERKDYVNKSKRRRIVIHDSDDEDAEQNKDTEDAEAATEGNQATDGASEEENPNEDVADMELEY